MHQKVANSLVRQGRPGDALAHAQRALELAADDPQTRVFLGQLYRLRRDSEAAETTLLAPTGAGSCRSS